MLCHSEQQMLCPPKLVSGSKKEIPSHGGQGHKTHSSFVPFVNQVRNDIMIELKPLCHSELVSESNVKNQTLENGTNNTKRYIHDNIRFSKNSKYRQYYN